MPRHFSETPPFRNIINVNWEDESFSATWILHFRYDYIPGPPPTVGCTPAAQSPNTSAAWFGPNPGFSWDLEDEIFLEGATEGLVVSGQPSAFSGSANNTATGGVDVRASTDTSPPVSITVRGETADINIIGADLTPFDCYGDNDEMFNPGGMNNIRGRQIAQPLHYSDVGGGTISASGISGTIDGIPAIKLFTEISYSTQGASVFVVFERAPP